MSKQIPMFPAAARVVVIGGGFGGFFATRKLCRLLKPAEAHITLVSDTDAMLYQPLLPDVAVGMLDPRSIAVPLRTTLRRARIVRGRALSLDAGRRSIKIATQTRTIDLPYDLLLLAPGAVTRMRDIPGLAEHAVGFKTAAEALYLRELVLSQLEIADSEPDPAQRRARMTFVVVGAGYAGTELAAQMVRLTGNMLPALPALSGTDVRWMLLDAAESVMPELGSELGDAALRLPRRRGVDVRLQTSIRQVDSAAVHLTDGTTIACSTVIWCAGVTASPLVTTLGLPLDRGRVAVTPSLDVAGHPDIFAIGDAAAVPDLASGTEERLCPPTAQHAMRQARTGQQHATSPLGSMASRSVPTNTATSGWSSTSAAQAQSPGRWVSRYAAGQLNSSPAGTTCTRCPASGGASASSAPGQLPENAPTTCRSGCWACIKPSPPAASIPRLPYWPDAASAPAHMPESAATAGGSGIAATPASQQD